MPERHAWRTIGEPVGTKFETEPAEPPPKMASDKMATPQTIDIVGLILSSWGPVPLPRKLTSSFASLIWLMFSNAAVCPNAFDDA